MSLSYVLNLEHNLNVLCKYFATTMYMYDKCVKQYIIFVQLTFFSTDSDKS